jgi:putative addiction module component (TIGR02574 family)
MSNYTEILTAALNLPPHERTELAKILLGSADTSDENLISPEWRKEIARRGAAYDRGELKGRPWDQFEDEIRRKYEDHA